MQIKEWFWQEVPSTTSTNDDAIELSAYTPYTQFIISAQEQTKGRGRLGRIWHSHKGNLFFSLGIKQKDIALNHWPFLSSLALAQSILHLSPSSMVSLKWPNDVLLQGHKVSGILLEQGQNNYTIVGIGINIVSSPSATEDFSYSVTSLRQCGIEVKTETFLQIFIDNLDKLMFLYQHQGFDIIRDKWMSLATHLNQNISINTPKGKLDGIFKGIATDGALILSQQGQSMSIYAGDVFEKRK
ncbi:MAG: biotin--[acetyl-CoA-carboxylase] ligase [Alphaproteobacteria bacterium]|nr:biotin--[acetyl-CoA-carboxylase] ligase [Alphaproteobacteria bacterium]